MSGLFRKINDRQETRLAFEASYFPLWRKTDSDKYKLAWNHVEYIQPREILNLLNEAHTEIMCPFRWVVDEATLKKHNPNFVIHWEYNHIPTKKEWEDMLYYNNILRVHYRVSPLIKDGGGRVAVVQHAKDRYSRERTDK